MKNIKNNSKQDNALKSSDKELSPTRRIEIELNKQLPDASELKNKI